MKRALVAGCLSALVFTSCSPSPAEIVSETADKLGDLRSGDLKLDLVATDATGDNRVGFSLSGPFSLPEGEGELPVFDIEYTDATSESTTAMISDGESVFIETEEGVVELEPDQVDSFRAAGGEGEGSVFEALDLEGWLKDPELEGGDGTDTIVADLDVVNALNDLFSLATTFGMSMPPPLEGESAEHVENAVARSKFELVTGAEDRLLRLLSITIDFEAANAPEVESIANLLGVHVQLDIEIEDPNEPVEVEAPDATAP